MRYWNIEPICGTIICSRKPESTNWWMIAKIDYTVGKYWRHLYKLQHNFCRKLSRPSHGEHVTIIGNEIPTNPEGWNNYAGKSIGLYLKHKIDYSDTCYWLEVDCPDAEQIRIDLGLSPKPKVSFHLAIGYIL
jgi:hypothetical protein